ncbi:MAG: hypothetical protein FJX46_02815 [Alphaproteobacteria bacterium]|nr:hypothetical protein [Alphaproteobacteria bacterium]
MTQALSRTVTMLAALAFVQPASAAVLAMGEHGHLAVIADDQAIDIGQLPAPLASVRFDPAGRQAVLATEDGHAVRIDLAAGRIVGQVRLRGRPAGLAASGDGDLVVVATLAPPSLSILAMADLTERHSIPLRIEGGHTPTPAAVLALPARKSFLVGFSDLAEVWEIPLGDNPPHRGWVHDYRNDGPPAAVPRFLPRRMPLPDVMTEIVALPDGEHLLGLGPGASVARGLDLYIGRVFAAVALKGQYAAGKALAAGAELVAIPIVEPAAIALVSAVDWRLVGQMPLSRPGGRLLAHPQPGHAIAIAGDRIEVLDLARRRVVAAATPRPGRALGAAALDRSGGRIMVALTAADEVLALDPASLSVTARIAIRAPTGLHAPE